MKGTVFKYRWPLLKEDLTHFEADVEVLEKGSFIRTNKQWWVYGYSLAVNQKSGWTYKNFYSVEDYMVPKDIRALALILNI